MILRGARVAVSSEQADLADIAVSGGHIHAIGRVRGKQGIDCSGYLALPGLINAHDHLEFNLFPRLGNGPYKSAAEWATDIHARFPQSIEKVLSVPLQERLIWGGIKNLVSGVTTVCHHNPWNPVFDAGFPVRVVRTFSWAHSLAFSRDLQTLHSACPKTRPFIFHAAEATNGTGKREMGALARLGLFASNSVMVHAVGLTRKSAELARARGCSLVWCPSSNLFTLGRTLSRSIFESGLPIALGTDSSLTAEGDMIDELRIARRVSRLSERTLYQMVTDGAAQVLRLSHGEGTIQMGGVADLLLFHDLGLTPARTLLRQTPQGVLVGGTPHMLSSELASAWGAPRKHVCTIAGRGAMCLRSKLPPMPAGLSLAGREVSA